MRPQREAYVRCVRQFGDCEVVTGVQMRFETEFDWLRNCSQNLMRAAYQAYYDDKSPSSPALGRAVEELIVEKWPDRAYFVEVTIGPERDCWTQIFQPWERP